MSPSVAFSRLGMPNIIKSRPWMMDANGHMQRGGYNIVCGVRGNPVLEGRGLPAPTSCGRRNCDGNGGQDGGWEG